jgi:hypothetical protein
MRGGSGQVRRAKLPAKYPLDEVKRLLAAQRLPTFVITKANNYLGLTTAQAAACVTEVLMSLEACDYVFGDSFVHNARGSIRTDIYAKKNEMGLWYVKLDIDDGGVLRIHSCHESERDEIELANGTTLRKDRHDGF